MTTPDNDAKDNKSEAKTVTLAVDGITSDAHRYGKGDDDVITREGTEVPASKAKQIVEQAAAQGVQIREVS